jgi:probable HAF family extracellular repeat protein
MHRAIRIALFFALIYCILYAEINNDPGTISGVGTSTSGIDSGFLLKNGSFSPITFPGAASTDAFKISNTGQIVGFYTDSSGVTHGFTRTAAGYQTIDFPGATLTHALGVNVLGSIVGDYVDTSGHTHGFLAIPSLDLN